jgi:transcriptional regulator with XRE-family HTH domain
VTRLEQFLQANGIKPGNLAEETGVSRQYLLKLRQGLSEPTRFMMVVLATGARRILHRKVRVQELFNLGDDSR